MARTCGSFSQEGGPCALAMKVALLRCAFGLAAEPLMQLTRLRGTGLGEFPNATISDYGSISGQSLRSFKIEIAATIVETKALMP